MPIAKTIMEIEYRYVDYLHQVISSWLCGTRICQSAWTKRPRSKFSEKATKIDNIFTVNLTVCNNHQINGVDLLIFVAFFRKHDLYCCRQKFFIAYRQDKRSGATESILGLLAYTTSAIGGKFFCLPASCKEAQRLACFLLSNLF